MGRFTSSCPAVYFEKWDPLVQNIISLHWEGHEDQGLVLYKVKSTSPGKYVVMPHVGYVDLQLQHGFDLSISVRSASPPSIPNGGRGYQDKFHVDYFVVAESDELCIKIRSRKASSTSKKEIETIVGIAHGSRPKDGVIVFKCFVDKGIPPEARVVRRVNASGGEPSPSSMSRCASEAVLQPDDDLSEKLRQKQTEVRRLKDVVASLQQQVNSTDVVYKRLADATMHHNKLMQQSEVQAGQIASTRRLDENRVVRVPVVVVILLMFVAFTVSLFFKDYVNKKRL